MKEYMIQSGARTWVDSGETLGICLRHARGRKQEEVLSHINGRIWDNMESSHNLLMRLREDPRLIVVERDGQVRIWKMQWTKRVA